MINKLILFLALTLSVLLHLNMASALGIAHPPANIDYEPGLETSYQFFAITNTAVSISKDGYLNEYISFSREFIPAEDPDKSFMVYIKLPEEYPLPGRHKVMVVVSQVATTGMIGTSVSGAVPVKINVKYPDEFVESSLTVVGAVKGEDIKLVFSVMNFGLKDVTSIKGMADIIDTSDNKKIETLETKSTNLSAGNSMQLISVLDTSGYTPGEYLAEAKLQWDGRVNEHNENFRIGDIEIRIVNHTDELIANKINKFDIEIESVWNFAIPGVFAEVNLTNTSGVVSSFKTPTTTVSPWSRLILSGFVNAEELLPDTYNALISVYYSDKETTKETQVSITETPHDEKPFFKSSTVVPILVIILIIVITTLNILYFKKRKKSDNNKNQEKRFGL